MFQPPNIPEISRAFTAPYPVFPSLPRAQGPFHLRYVPKGFFTNGWGELVKNKQGLTNGDFAGF